MSGSGLPWWLSGKDSACNAGDAGSFPGSGRSMEKGVATHSSILAWRIPWTEESAGLHYRGSKESDLIEWLNRPAQWLGSWNTVRLQVIRIGPGGGTRYWNKESPKSLGDLRAYTFTDFGTYTGENTDGRQPERLVFDPQNAVCIPSPTHPHRAPLL